MNSGSRDTKGKVRYAIYGIVVVILIVLLFLIASAIITTVAVVFINKTNLDPGTIFILIFLSGLLCVIFFGLYRFVKSKNIEI